MGEWVQGEWRWKVIWRRALRDSEEAGVAGMIQFIQNFQPTEGRADRWIWGGTGDGAFLVKKAYKELEIQRRAGEQPWRSPRWPNFVWKSTAPFKAQVMGWRLLWNRLPTIDNLYKKIGILVADVTCCCCKNEEETSCHLFLACTEILKLWAKMQQWCGTCWAAPNTFEEHFIQFSNLLGGGKAREIMGGLWICIVWVWWKWRNTVRFDNKEWNLCRIEDEIKCRFWNWCMVREEVEANWGFETWSRTNLCDLWSNDLL